MKCGHTILTNGCKVCKALEQRWYKKLSESFDDAEDCSNENRPLKCWHNFLFRKLSLEEIEDAHIYYDRTHRLLRGFEFENETVKRIWELHCEGMSSPQIENEIKDMQHARKELTIRNIIKDLEREIQW